MPIEIKELHIRVAVNTLQNEPSTESDKAFSGTNTADASEVDTDSIIAECVEQVLQILQNKKER